MNCEAWATKLDQYVDAELSTDEQRAFDDHLKSCLACSGEALDRFRLKQATQLAGNRFAPSTEFRDRIRTQIAGGRRRSRGFGWTPTLAAVAALLLVSIVSYLFVAQRSARRRLLAEVADIHVSNLASASPVEVVSTDRHTVKPWFQGKLPFTFNLPDLSGSEFTLVGGRMVFLDHEPTALLLFKYKSHYLSTFVLQNRTPMSTFGAHAKEASFNTVSWETGGLRYVIVTDASRDEADALAQLLKRSAMD